MQSLMKKTVGRIRLWSSEWILTKITFFFVGFQHHHQSKWSAWCSQSFGATKNNNWSLAIGQKLHLKFFWTWEDHIPNFSGCDFRFFLANFRLEKWSSGNFCRNSAQPLSLIYISMVRLCVMSGSNTGLEAHIQK